MSSTLGLLAATLVLAAPSELPLKDVIRDQFEAAGRSMPPFDPMLSQAAQQVAERAIVKGVEEAASLLRVTAAISKNGGWDPSPTAIVIRGKADQLAKTLKTNAMADEPVSLVGLAVVEREGHSAAAVLLARRKMDLDPFPRTLAKASSTARSLCGVLREPLTSGELFITRPAGEVDRVELQATTAGKRCANVTFATVGRHTVEVLGTGPRGPEVAALFFVDVGAIGLDDELVSAEPPSDLDARAQLLVRINALRLRMGLNPVKPDPALEAVAQTWATRLARENFFSHVAPDGSDLMGRLHAAKYPYAGAGENLGLSSGPLSAHFGIEHSPGHRRNLLEKTHQVLGIGLAKRADGMTVLVEVLAQPAAAAPTFTDPVGAAYKAIADERARRHLPTLVKSPVLEALAQQHARDAFDAGVPKAQLPGHRRLHDQVFAQVELAKTVSVDIVISESPTLIVDSKNLGARQNSMVGVGLVQGDSAQYGKARYWIVVVYAGGT
jgi:uncharacterized protein YkwD